VLCVCVCVCLSASISPERHVQSLPNVLCMLFITVAQSFSGGVTKSQGKGQFWRFAAPFKSIGNFHDSFHCSIAVTLAANGSVNSQ